ncbi:hypothetical protein NMG29_25715 [Streptomyces cocklensis]|uniref:Uncharacterized protein n=1 Tax=Actinacidiphila cocklensis TaxID=887465 RepID=A0A9W4GPF2_9ACTN|nr:hypothetical protein [Actinacidiphila cocklensis]MDD1061573.1 hypothetical protein [Actinacidiphila cocklensis]CAG6392308.1 conserved exported hypothetical protein [Actinacidiphila cocklensis]
MNQVARRLGKTFALVLPVVLVLSGTLAVTRVPWAVSSSDAQVLTASAKSRQEVAAETAAKAPQEALRMRLLAELQEKDPGVALTGLQVAMARQPSLAKYCASIARSLGRAAVAKYDGATQRAQSWSRPVCDTAFATGIASVG